MPEARKQIYIDSLPDYEMRLLTALSYFLGRQASTQAIACLSMYLRQSEPRIMSQLRYYAHKAQMDEYDLLDLIYENPDEVDRLLKVTGKVHPSDESDIFEVE
jgi:hypothetical protein